MSLFNKFRSECENGYVSLDTLNQIIGTYHNNLIWNVGLGFACQFGHFKLVEFMISKGADNFKEGVYCSFNHMMHPNLQRFTGCKIADLMLSYSDDSISVRSQSTTRYKKYKSEQLLITKLHTDLILYIVSKYSWSV